MEIGPRENPMQRKAGWSRRGSDPPKTGAAPSCRASAGSLRSAARLLGHTTWTETDWAFYLLNVSYFFIVTGEQEREVKTSVTPRHLCKGFLAVPVGCQREGALFSPPLIGFYWRCWPNIPLCSHTILTYMQVQ